MAYNLQSLITILEQILDPQQTRWILDHNEPQLQSLFEKATSLEQVLDKSSPPIIESLESQIRDAAHKAEDIIEAQMVDQMLSRREGVSFTFSTPDVQHITQELDSAMERVLKLMEGNAMSCGSSQSGASLSRDVSSKSVMVGVDEDLLQLKDRLTGMQRKLEIIPIVGMGGIGKTALARNLYQDPLIVSHFDVRAWSTISQDYNIKAILSDLGCKNGKDFDEHIELNHLYKSLCGRRFLIVFDDIWGTKFWDEIRMYFPNNDNGSRILITTRESDVGKHADSQSVQHQVQLLSKSESRNLLRQIVFGEDDCPVLLKEIGKRIASDCGGLPLALNVVGGLLSKLERSKDVWGKIGNDVRAAITESDEQFSNILTLSYNHLPNHLKPCFLYMAAFPEDYEIKASRLVRLWVAEGFVKSNGDKSLEEEAKDYLDDLVERNLLLVTQKKRNGKPKKRYSIHDLLRDLCIKKADEENFLHVKNGPEVTFYDLRRVSVHAMKEDVCDSPEWMALARFLFVEDGDLFASAELMSLARSFLCIGRMSRVILSPSLTALRLLRVLDVMEYNFQEFPTEILQLVNLRYLAFSTNSGLPRGISRLWNLQTLVASLDWGDLPYEIWEMSELRHLKLKGPIWTNYIKKSIQKNLQTISRLWLTHSVVRNGFFESIPSIKDLGLFCDLVPCAVVDLSHLHKLETLRCHSVSSFDGSRFLPTLRFPGNLRKLVLDGCVITPGVLKTLCALPNLEVLKLCECEFENDEAHQEWEVAEGEEFSSLQFLNLSNLNLVHWRADETNFPRLRHLHLEECRELEEIPSGFGEIPTLQLIQLEYCSASAVASAEQIVEVQQSEFDNYDLQLRIYHTCRMTRSEECSAMWTTMKKLVL